MKGLVPLELENVKSFPAFRAFLVLGFGQRQMIRFGDCSPGVPPGQREGILMSPPISYGLRGLWWIELV